jgi:hypothetical protein
VIDLAGLPAGPRVSSGLRDLEAGDLTIDALLVTVASRRLEGLGLPIPPRELLPSEPELALYELLCARSEDAFYAYRAILDELDSFISSLEARDLAGS